MSCTTEEKGHKPFSTQCAPKKICSVISNLEESQREAIRKCGFGQILEIKPTMLRHSLLEELIDGFNPCKCTLKAHDFKIKVSAKEFEQIMGVPEGGTDIILDGEEQEVPEEFKRYCSSDSNRTAISTSKLRSQILASSYAGDHFVQIFILYLMGVLLVPTRREDIPLSLANTVSIVADIPTKNWASYCFNYLVNSISSHKASRRQYIPGCVFFMELIFLEHADGTVHTTDAISPLARWDNKAIRSLLKKTVSRRNNSNVKRITSKRLVSACLQSSPTKRRRKDEEPVGSEVIQVRLGKMEDELQNLKKELKVDVTSTNEAFHARFLNMEQDFRSFKEKFKVALGTIIEAVNPSKTVDLTREEPTKLKEDNPKSELIKTTEADYKSSEETHDKEVHSRDNFTKTPSTKVANFSPPGNEGEEADSSGFKAANFSPPRKQAKEGNVNSPSGKAANFPPPGNEGEKADSSGFKAANFSPPGKQAKEVNVKSPSAKAADFSPSNEEKEADVKNVIKLSDESEAAVGGSPKDKRNKGRNPIVLRSPSKLRGSKFVLSPYERANPRAKKADSWYHAPPFVVKTPLSMDGLKMVQFVFSKELPKSNELVKAEDGDLFLSREEFDLLRPTRKLSTRIIVMVCLCKTNEERRDRRYGYSWFFPPSVSDRAYFCSEDQFMDFMKKYKIRSRYCIDKLIFAEKIYVPIFNLELKHFYLAVFKLATREVEIWDSIPGTHNKEYDGRLRQLRIGLDILLWDEIEGRFSFEDFTVKYRSDIAAQPNGFDYGVFVIKYMLDPDGYSDKHFPFDSDYERAQIALYLLTTPANEIKDKVREQSFQYFQSHVKVSRIQPEVLNFRQSLVKGVTTSLHSFGDKKRGRGARRKP